LLWSQWPRHTAPKHGSANKTAMLQARSMEDREAPQRERHHWPTPLAPHARELGVL